MRYSGRCLTSLKTLPRYSPTTPRVTSCAAPKNSTTAIRLGYPGTSLPNISVRTSSCKIKIVEASPTSSPRYVATRNGIVVKLVMPSTAKFQSRQ